MPSMFIAKVKLCKNLLLLPSSVNIVQLFKVHRLLQHAVSLKELQDSPECSVTALWRSRRRTRVFSSCSSEKLEDSPESSSHNHHTGFIKNAPQPKSQTTATTGPAVFTHHFNYHRPTYSPKPTSAKQLSTTSPTTYSTTTVTSSTKPFKPKPTTTTPTKKQRKQPKHPESSPN
jgi:hypothetical protein